MQKNNAKKIVLNARDHAIDFYKVSGYTIVKILWFRYRHSTYHNGKIYLPSQAKKSFNSLELSSQISHFGIGDYD